MWVLQLMDHYSAGFCVLVIAVVECVVINWIYGQCSTSEILAGLVHCAFYMSSGLQAMIKWLLM